MKKSTFGKKLRNRHWKEYLIESLLIVFSVLLALFLTESINKSHDRKYTVDLLKNIVIELKNNKTAILQIQEYNLKVLNKINSALADKKIQDSIVSNSEFHLNVIAPHGVLLHYLDDEAWTIAKNNNIMSKINIESISILNKVYENLERIGKVEDEVAQVIFERNSRDPRQIQSTLIIIRDIYLGWAVDRVPGLLARIDTAIIKIENNIPQKNK
jgi:hypothetical protein